MRITACMCSQKTIQGSPLSPSVVLGAELRLSGLTGKALIPGRWLLLWFWSKPGGPPVCGAPPLSPSLTVLELELLQAGILASQSIFITQRNA